MTNKEAAKLLRNGGHPSPYIPLNYEQAREIADLLDPPKHPEPGAFVQFRFTGDPENSWWPGIVSDHEDKPGVFDAAGELYSWGDNIVYRPVYTVTPPPLGRWMRDDEFRVGEHGAGLLPKWGENPSFFGKHVTTVTREEMEAQNENS